jgi:hypothetical protein
MTDQVIIALIAAGSVLLGGGLTGIITLINQRMALKAADRKTRWEIADRDRTRFHEARKETYAEFLTAVDDATGYISSVTAERLKNAGKPGQFEVVTRPGFENFGPGAVTRMTRQQSIVDILSGSSEVRQASKDLMDSVLAFSGLAPDWYEWSEALNARKDAYGRFMKAANAELTGQMPSSPTTNDASRLPTER